MRCPAQGTPVSSCLGGPFLFPSSAKEEKSLFWLLALRQDLCEGGQGKALGTVTAVRVLAKDRTLRELLHLSSVSVTEARVQAASS